jgi:hypothetical protein
VEGIAFARDASARAGNGPCVPIERLNERSNAIFICRRPWEPPLSCGPAVARLQGFNLFWLVLTPGLNSDSVWNFGQIN